MKRKVLLLFIFVCVNMFVFGIVDVSADFVRENGFTIKTSNGEATIVKYDCTVSGELVIPSTIAGCTVTCIDDDAFRGCDEITSIKIPDSIRYIGAISLNCNSLANINVSENNKYYSSIDGNLYNKDKTKLIRYAIGKTNASFTVPDGVTNINSAFSGCNRLVEIKIPNSVTNIGGAFENCKNLAKVNIPDNVTNINSAFSGCSNLMSITIPNGVTKIGEHAFSNCNNLADITMPNSITVIGVGAFENCSKLTNVTIPDRVTKIEEYAFSGCNNLANITMPNSITVIGVGAFLNCSKLIDITIHNSIVEIGYDAFSGCVNLLTIYYNGDEKDWSKVSIGGNDGCIENAEKKYFWYVAFIDEDGREISKEKYEAGSVINPPDILDKTEYYIFDTWQGYTSGMTATENVTFRAVFKYKEYTIIAEGLDEPIAVTYNSRFKVTPQTKDEYHYFIGYFTEKDGKGARVTDENGESLDVYNTVGDLNVYPYFYEGYINKIELQGKDFALPGGTIVQNAIFATDKNVMYLRATVKYSKKLSLKNIKGVDFIEVSTESEKTVGDYVYLDITCIYDYEGNFAPINTNLVPFEIEFDIAKNTPVGNMEISLEDVIFSGDNHYNITDIINHKIEIKPTLEIIGKDKIDSVTQFSIVVLPDYTTDRSVVWSVDNEDIAKISQDGIVTPVKNGTVTITATTNDASKIFATKVINVVAYAKIENLEFGDGVCVISFSPDIRKYTVYVKENATSITLTPTFSGGGVLRANGSGLWLSGNKKEFILEKDGKTTVLLNRENVKGMTNGTYTVEVVKFEGTQSSVSNDGKTVNIKPVNIVDKAIVILALYDGEKFVEMQSKPCEENVSFTTDKAYTMAKVMIWENIDSVKPMCGVEIVN